MRAVGGTLFCVSLPFVERFSHSLGSRTASESVILEITTASGAVGYGEGMPRTYVTGEDFESCCRHAREELWPRVRELQLPDAGASLSDLLVLLDGALPANGQGEAIAHNAVRCAFELALVDVWLRSCGRSLSETLGRKRDEVSYSAVIPTGSLASTESHAKQWKVLGFDQVKLKIDGTEDGARAALVREVFGTGATLRVDGNAAYSVESGLACLEELASYDVASAEQMLARGSLEDWAALRARSPIPLMVDESLVTLDDALRLVNARACDLFNVRLSKCGGLGPTLKIVECARTAGLGFQIGCHVGESAILSAAGRHLACHLADSRFLEGSFGNLLLKEDVSRETVRFGHRGRARFLGGPGLGVEVRADVLRRHAAHVLKLD